MFIFVICPFFFKPSASYFSVCILYVFQYVFCMYFSVCIFIVSMVFTYFKTYINTYILLLISNVLLLLNLNKTVYFYNIFSLYSRIEIPCLDSPLLPKCLVLSQSAGSAVILLIVSEKANPIISSLTFSESLSDWRD